MTKENIVLVIGAVVMTVLVMGATLLMFGMVGGNQSEPNLGAGTRFPSGISADTTSPNAGQVRGTTQTITGASTLSGAVTVGTTLGVTGATTLSSTLSAAATSTFVGIESYLENATTTSTGVVTYAVTDSGKTIYIPGTGSIHILPAVVSSNGVVLRFVVGEAFGTDFSIDSAEGDNIEGSLMVAGAIVDCPLVDQINFIADGENVGDFVELRSNGVRWFIGASNALTAAKLTCTDPS